MELKASLMSKNRYDELLAIVNVLNNTAQVWGEDFKRKVTASINQFGSIWNDFVGFWSSANCIPLIEDGKDYFAVNCLQVDHDRYGFFSWINIEDKIIRLILLEHFTGSEEEYYHTIRERNKKVQDYLERWARNDLTVNDMREIEGLPKRDEPFFDQPLKPEILSEMRKIHLKRAELNGLTYNLVV